MDVVNRLGGDNRMSEEELCSTFNDAAVSIAVCHQVFVTN